MQELHTKHADEALKAEKWQFEFKNLKEKFEALLKEKEVMRVLVFRTAFALGFMLTQERELGGSRR